MIGHVLLAVAVLGMAVGIFALGWSACIWWGEWRDDRALRAAEARYERHTHRKGEPLPPLPTSGRIPLERLADPEPLPGEPPWLFAGESAPGWGSESAEYELLTQTAEQPVSVTGEQPIDTGELMAITDRVEAWIAGWAAQGNYDRHTIQAGDS